MRGALKRQNSATIINFKRLTNINIKLIASGNKMPDWIQRGFETYQKRFRPPLQLTLHEIALGKRGKQNAQAAIVNKEKQLILNAIGADYLIVLDERAPQYNSQQLAQRLRYWQQHHRQISLLIGAPEGIDATIKAQADESWSLSALTLPHSLARVVVAEALYRAWTINCHHPYHRDC